MTRRAASRASEAGAGDVDFFRDGPAPWISRRDARHPLRKPSLYAEVLATADRAVLCTVAAQMLEEASGGPLELGSFIASATAACAEGEQRERLGEILNRVPLHDLSDFVRRVRALRRA